MSHMLKHRVCLFKLWVGLGRGWKDWGWGSYGDDNGFGVAGDGGGGLGQGGRVGVDLRFGREKAGRTLGKGLGGIGLGGWGLGSGGVGGDVGCNHMGLRCDLLDCNGSGSHFSGREFMCLHFGIAGCSWNTLVRRRSSLRDNRIGPCCFWNMNFSFRSYYPSVNACV